MDAQATKENSHHYLFIIMPIPFAAVVGTSLVAGVVTTGNLAVKACAQLRSCPYRDAVTRPITRQTPKPPTVTPANGRQASTSSSVLLSQIIGLDPDGRRVT